MDIKTWKVLDHGFIKLIDVLGNDETIVNAARQSYSGEGTKSFRDNRRLIRYLMRHEHWTPFEMCEIILQVKVPLFIWRQWIRHRTASVNEMSGRYSILPEEYYLPEKWRVPDKYNKQGSEAGEELPHAELTEKTRQITDACFENYKSLLEDGVAREQARVLLPLNVYTVATWKIDLRNLLNFLKQRMDDHAQLEIREYANIIGHEIVAMLFPLTWEAYWDYIKNSLRFSLTECKLLSAILDRNHKRYVELVDYYSDLLLTPSGEKSGELREFEEKVKLLKPDIEFPPIK